MPPAKKKTEPVATLNGSGVVMNTETVKTETKPERTETQKKGQTSAEIAASIIKKKMGIDPMTAYLGSKPFVSSGSVVVDDLIGGTLAADGKPKCPGFPRRHITEIYGAESSGKTTAALEAIAEAQKNGGWAMFLDFEHALDHGYAKAVGVSFDPSKLLLYQPTTFEEGLKMMWMGITMGADLIVIDSVASMVPKAELEKGPDDASAIGALSRAMSTALPKIGVWLCNPANKNPLGTALIFINQERALISTGGRGPSSHTAGGKALKYYAYLRLAYTRIRGEVMEKKSKITGKVLKVPYGSHTQVKVVKSKIDAKQGQTGDVFIRFGVGIDDHFSVIEAGVTNKLVKRDGAWYSYNGERYQGREGFRNFLKTDDKVFAQLRKDVMFAMHSGAVDSQAPEDEDEFETLSVGLETEFGEEGASTSSVEELVLDEPSDD